MPSPVPFYDTLMKKLKPSFDIQQMGSINPAIRSSSTFGPTINYLDWRKLRGKQAGSTLQNQLGDMNR